MGIRVDSTNHISSILPGSVAAEDGTIAVGDRIITVSSLLAIKIKNWVVWRLVPCEILKDHILRVYEFSLNLFKLWPSVRH